MTPGTRDSLDELRRGWPTLCGAILGIASGVIALPFAATSLFMSSLQAGLGWSRTEISLASTLLLGVLALSAPLAGWLCDRVSEARIAAASIAALGLVFAALGQAPANLGLFYAAFALMGFLGAGAATLTFARAISRTFVAARGLALGLSMIGTGLSGLLLPIFLAPYVADHGWRSGFGILAAIAGLTAPVVYLLLRSSPGAEAVSSSGAIARLVFDRTFLTLALTFCLVPLAAAGLQLHFVAFLTDAGLSPARAGGLAGLVGLSILAGRVATGWLMDLLFAPFVAAAMMMFSAAGLALLGLMGAPAALAGVVALGLCLGAEIDLIGYLTARYYGLAAYGKVYGIFYTVCLAGTALSPLAYGALRDAFGGYQTAQFAGAATLALSSVAFLTLPRFPAA